MAHLVPEALNRMRSQQKNHYTQIHQYQYSHTEILGKGGFGTVYKCYSSQNMELALALKIMDMNNIISNPTLNNLFQNEQQCLQAIKGSNVVNAIEIIQQSPYIYIVSPLCNGGDLRQYLTKKKNHLLEKEAIMILQDMLKGLKEMVKNGFVHRDLKPENTFIHDNIYKIADFGFCQKAYPNQIMDTYLGTPGYMSPQIVFKTPYTSKCDIWSLGVIYYEMLFGTLPGRGSDEFLMAMDIKQNGIQYPHAINTSQLSRSFLEGCLQVEEEKRFSWDQVFSDPICGVHITSYIAQRLSLKDQNTLKPITHQHTAPQIDLKHSSHECLNHDMRRLSVNDPPTLDSLQKQQKVDQAHLEYMELPNINLKPHEIDFMKSLQKYLLSNSENLHSLLLQFFPRQKISFQEFHYFCSKSKVSEQEIQELFCYFHRDQKGEITLDEFQYRVLNTNYEKNELNEILLKHKVKAIIKNLRNTIEKKNTNLILLFERFHPGNGSMSHQQFNHFIWKVDPTLIENEINMVFKFFDKDVFILQKRIMAQQQWTNLQKQYKAITKKQAILMLNVIKKVLKLKIGIKLTPTSLYTLKSLEFIIHKFKLNVKNLYMQYDHTHQGHLDLHDFTDLIHFISRNIDEEHCKEIYQLFQNEKGYIFLDDFIDILQ